MRPTRAHLPYRTRTRPLTQMGANDEKTLEMGPEPTSTALSGAAGDGWQGGREAMEPAVSPRKSRDANNSCGVTRSTPAPRRQPVGCYTWPIQGPGGTCLSTCGGGNKQGDDADVMITLLARRRTSASRAMAAKTMAFLVTYSPGHDALAHSHTRRSRGAGWAAPE